MANFFEDCLRDLSRKVKKPVPPQEFSQVFCQRCRNAECDLAGWNGDLFTKRIRSQERRLLDPAPADSRLPKYAQIVDTDFKDMFDHAMRLEIADRRGDWNIPEITVSDGRQETASRETTHAVDTAIRNLAQAQGQPEPNLPDPTLSDAFASQAETMLNQLEESHEEEPISDLPPIGFPRDQSRPPLPQPFEKKAPFQVPGRSNTDEQTGGLMVGGGPRPPPKKRAEPVDPWAPPKKPAALKVEPGARIRMGTHPEEEE